MNCLCETADSVGMTNYRSIQKAALYVDDYSSQYAVVITGCYMCKANYCDASITETVCLFRCL